MSKDAPHRGIFYSIHRLGEQRWKWQIEPPACIRGLRTENGEVTGQRTDAVAAAQKAIDAQTQQFTQ